MKISLVLPDFAGGGAERVFTTLAREFVERGHDVDLVIANNNNPAYLHLIPAQVRIIDLKAARMRQSLSSLIKYFRQHQPDVVMATRLHSCCFVVLAKIFSGINTKVVLREANTPSSDLNKYARSKRLLLTSFVRFLYPLADAIICVSQGAVNDTKEFIKTASGKVHLIYNPVLTEDLFIDAAKPCEHPWFSKNTIPVIVSVGRLSSQKRFDVLIKAFAVVHKRRPVRLLILGDGGDRPALQSLIMSLNLQDDVSLPGFDSNPFRFMANADLFVLSSAWEGLPGALIQALACGCPVVSTDCPSGPREILKAGRLGKLVPVNDSEAMAKAIEETLDQKPRRISQEDLNEYTVDQAIDRYLRIFGLSNREMAPCAISKS